MATKSTKPENPGPCYVPGWEKKLAAGKSILPDPKKLSAFNKTAADRGLALYKGLRIPSIPGAPLAGDASPQWLLDLIWYWLGAQDKDGNRSVQEMLLLVSKKNAKTSSMAMVLLVQWLEAAERLPTSTAVLLAPTAGIAKFAFAVIAGVLEQNGRTNEYKINRGRMEVKHIKEGYEERELRVIATENASLGGTVADFIMLDEMHLLADKSSAADLMQHVRGPQKVKPWASCIICTTHAHKHKDDIWTKTLKSYRAIHEGRIDIPRLMVRYEFPDSYLKDDKYLDPKYWHMTNPSLGKVGTIEWLKDTLKAAEEEGPKSRGEFLNQNLNIPPGEFRGDTAWDGVDYWDTSFDSTIAGAGMEAVDAIIDRSDCLTIGIDGGGLHDLQALALMGRDMETRQWLYWGHAWIDSAVQDKRPSLWQSLIQYQDMGELSVVDFGEKSANGDYNIALEELAQLVSYINMRGAGRLGPKHSVGIDFLQKKAVLDALMNRNLDAPLLTSQIDPVQQGSALSPDFNTLAAKCRQGDFRHGGLAITKWAVLNVQMEYTGRHLVATKENLAPDKKIDPFMALVFAGRQMGRGMDDFIPSQLYIVGADPAPPQGAKSQ